MSHELIYLLLICSLMILPRALQRFRLPAPLTCLLFGLGLALAWPAARERHHDALQLLASLGISSLFLYAGLEVDLAGFRRGLVRLATYLVVRTASLAALAWIAWRVLGLQWQAAALLALALLTSSTGFIIDSLDRYHLREDERFWITNKAILGELYALALMFFLLKADDPADLARSSAILLALAVAVPVLFVTLLRWVVPHAPNSEFSLLVTVGFASAYVTDKLGVEYLLGAFLAGFIARQLQPRLPTLASADNLDGIKLFSSFFVPFYFFLNGARVPVGALTWQAALVGVVLAMIFVPGRYLAIRGQRRWLFRDASGSSTRVALALMPTLIFTLVLATLLHERFGIPDPLFGGLLLYAGLTTLLPSLVLRAPFDVATGPLPPSGLPHAPHGTAKPEPDASSGGSGMADA